MKNLIRNEMLNIRKDILDKKKKSTMIVDKILNLEIYKKSSVIAVYKSLNNEVDTSDLIKNMLDKKIVLLPRINDNKMEFIKISNKTKYERNSMGIEEPIGKANLGKIDLIIVPGVAFDEKNNRLGYGKGFYDKFLTDKDIYKIGICFSEQLIDVLPITNTDIKMDLVITDKKI